MLAIIKNKYYAVYSEIILGVRGYKMHITYKKLWKLLIDRDLKKRDLCEMAGISSASMAKLGKNENINTSIIVRICEALNCDTSDIMEIEKTEGDR